MKRIAPYIVGSIVALGVLTYIDAYAAARSAPHLQRWEYVNYYCSEGKSWVENEAAINKLGAEGWEMTGTLNGRIYFKRPVSQ